MDGYNEAKSKAITGEIQTPGLGSGTYAPGNF